jgi:hypothetical protein
MLKNIKNTTIGIIIGISIASIPTFAGLISDKIVQPYKTFVLTQVTYPIVVNGQEYINDELPVLNHQGSTYVPLKIVGDMLDSNVE